MDRGMIHALKWDGQVEKDLIKLLGMAHHLKHELFIYGIIFFSPALMAGY